MSSPNLRYARHHVLAGFGEDGQARLAAARVLLVGLGGIGSAAALYLASAGVGRLVLNDFDTIDVTNLARQPLYSDDDLGARKAVCAARHLKTRRADLDVEVVTERLAEADLEDWIRRCDLVIDASDNFPTRFGLNRLAFRARRPLVTAAALGYVVQLTVSDARRGAGCYRCLFTEESDDDLETAGCGERGVLGPLVAVAGGLAAAEALRILASGESVWHGHLFHYDARYGTLRRSRIRPDPLCPVCAGAALES